MMQQEFGVEVLTDFVGVGDVVFKRQRGMSRERDHTRVWCLADALASYALPIEIMLFIARTVEGGKETRGVCNFPVPGASDSGHGDAVFDEGSAENHGGVFGRVFNGDVLDVRL